MPSSSPPPPCLIGSGASKRRWQDKPKENFMTNDSKRNRSFPASSSKYLKRSALFLSLYAVLSFYCFFRQGGSSRWLSETERESSLGKKHDSVSSFLASPQETRRQRKQQASSKTAYEPSKGDQSGLNTSVSPAVYHEDTNDTNTTSYKLDIAVPDDANTTLFQLDLAVPVSGNKDKLLLLAANIGDAIRNMHRASMSFHTVRMLITQYPGDDMSEDFTSQMNLKFGDARTQFSVSYVPMPSNATAFHRAHACNALHRAACTDPRCLFTVVDVDMSIRPEYLHNVLTYVGTNATDPSIAPVVYFPMVWSQFHDTSIRLVEKVLEKPGMILGSYSPHAGVYRLYGYGMYAFPGPVATFLFYDESFVGWGGEDKDFHQRAVAEEKKNRLSIVREKEPGLVHVWHDKSCELGAFVTKKFQKQCMGSLNRVEGSIFGRLLLLFGDKFEDWLIRKREAGIWTPDQIDAMFSENITSFGDWFRSEQQHDTDDFRFLSQLFLTNVMNNTATETDRDALIELLNEAEMPYSMFRLELFAQKAKLEAGADRKPPHNILILVSSTRRDIKRRGSAHETTWADPDTLPPNVHIQYVTGDLNPKFTRSYVAGSAKDRSSMAGPAGISDPTRISIIGQIMDKYVVAKRAKFIKVGNELADSIEKDTGNSVAFDWIVMVYDDTYISARNLVAFLKSKDPKEMQYLGLSQTDPSGGGQSVCHDAAGVVLSRPTLRVLAEHAEECIKLVGRKESDALISACLRQHAVGLECNHGKDDNASLFLKQGEEPLDQVTTNNAITIFGLNQTKFTASGHADLTEYHLSDQAKAVS